MNSAYFSHKFYEKYYYTRLIELFPVIREINVSSGNLTDLRITITYAKFYTSPPKGFGNALRFTMMQFNEFLSEWPSMTLELNWEDEIVWGTFIEDSIEAPKNYIYFR